MMWERDPMRYEKYLIFDAIIEFSRQCEGKDFGDISIRTLQEFVDTFLADVTMSRYAKGLYDNEEGCQKTLQKEIDQV